MPAQPPPPPGVPPPGAGPTASVPTGAAPTGAAPAGFLPGYGPPGQAHPALPQPGRDAPALLAQERSIWRLARVAVVIVGIYFLWAFIYLRAESALYRSIGHQYHRLIIAGENNRPAPHITFVHPVVNGGIVALGLVLDLAAIAAVVVACMWQYRAASTARALGLPAKHSPGWGVGSWFVPIVNYWMPYQAIRDCLAKDDPNRRVVALVLVLLHRAGRSFLAAAVATALFSTSLSLAVSIPGALLALGVLGHRAQVRHGHLLRRTRRPWPPAEWKPPFPGNSRNSQLFTLRFRSGYEEFIWPLYGPD